MKTNKIIISVAVYLIALFNDVKWKILKMKPSVRRESRKLREYYKNQTQEMEKMIIEEKNKNIKELKSQLKESNQKASDCNKMPIYKTSPNRGADMRERKKVK